MCENTHYMSTLQNRHQWSLNYDVVLKRGLKKVNHVNCVHMSRYLFWAQLSRVVLSEAVD